MKVIIDTNVLVSAILKNRTPEKIVLHIIQNPQFEWLASSNILGEYKGVLIRPKFKLPVDILEEWFSIFEQSISIVENDAVIDFPRDQKDAMFLECAISHQADIFISGDKDFSEAQKLVKNTQILSITDFYNHFVLSDS